MLNLSWECVHTFLNIQYQKKKLFKYSFALFYFNFFFHKWTGFIVCQQNHPLIFTKTCPSIIWSYQILLSFHQILPILSRFCHLVNTWDSLNNFYFLYFTWIWNLKKMAIKIRCLLFSNYIVILLRVHWSETNIQSSPIYISIHV